MATNSGRRPQTDDITWATTGAQDRNRRNGKGRLMQDDTAREAAAGAKSFEGSFTTQDSPGLTRKRDLGSD